MSSPTTNQITNSSQVSGVTLTDVLNALRITVGDGSGDMVRAVYDTDNDGKVDVASVAEAVPWTGVTGKPTLFPAQPYTHSHAISEVTGLQDAINELDSEKFDKSGGDIAGNINFTGSSRRIQVPAASVPVGNRMLFQSSSTNELTFIGVIPSGTARQAGITFSNSSDPDNAGYGYISMSDVNMTITSAIALGTGGTGGVPGAVPLVLSGRSASMSIGDGDVVVTNGMLGYGGGGGGTVTQETSKSTGVAINKPSGKITMHDASLAAGASVSFPVTNSLVNGSPVSVVGEYETINPANYRIETEYSGYGGFSIKVTNISDSSRSESLVISFAILKRATT